MVREHPSLVGLSGIALLLDFLRLVKLNKFYSLTFCFWILKPQILRREWTLMPHTLASGCNAFWYWDCSLCFSGLIKPPSRL